MRWNLKKRKIRIYGMLAIVGALMLVAITTVGSVQWIFMIATFVAIVGYVVVWAVLWRCPHCGAMLGRMDDATHCKYCGKKLYPGD